MAKEWLIPPPSPNCDIAARRWRLPSVVAQLLINRGVCIDEPEPTFLAPELKDLCPPRTLPGASEAARKIAHAIRSKARIVLYGDYDVDGTTGIAILWHVLRCGGADASFYVPHRVEEGYGLNPEAAKLLVDQGAQMIISIDCSITAVDVVDQLREAGVTTIITDHHAPHEKLPRADVIVHPSLDSTYPNPDLAGAGVAFKLAWAIAQELSDPDPSTEREIPAGPTAPPKPGGTPTEPAGDEADTRRVSPEFRSLLLDMLPLAMLGTIADVVPLRGENRIIAKHGLQRLGSSSLPGIKELISSAKLDGKDISGYDVGFKLAPRINAAGRMGHARLAVELFTRADHDRAREIALYLEEHNRSRRALERKIFKDACDMVERKGLANDARRALVLAKDGWHTGVIGIVASRVAERYNRPTIMIAISNGQGQGSGRSIRHFDLAEALNMCGDHLISHGGHAMAAGLRIAGERVQSFTDAFIEVANNRLTGRDLVEKLRLDAEVSLGVLTLETTELIRQLGPFGAGNPRPHFATDWVELGGEPRCVGQQLNHLQATFVQDGATMKGIGFGLGGFIEDLKHHRRCRVAFEPIINEFNGRRTVEMRMIDLMFPK